MTDYYNEDQKKSVIFEAKALKANPVTTTAKASPETTTTANATAQSPEATATTSKAVKSEATTSKEAPDEISPAEEIKPRAAAKATTTTKDDDDATTSNTTTKGPNGDDGNEMPKSPKATQIETTSEVENLATPAEVISEEDDSEAEAEAVDPGSAADLASFVTIGIVLTLVVAVFSLAAVGHYKTSKRDGYTPNTGRVEMKIENITATSAATTDDDEAKRVV